jgi:uncharacterized repeat protein (TIGR03803 family)
MKPIAIALGKPNWGKGAYAVLALYVATAIALAAQTLTTLVNFRGANGVCPAWGNPVQGTDGSFYWSAQGGGTSTACKGGCGTVFKVARGGTLTTLHNFSSADGQGPQGALVLATNGDFYGTTVIGGASGAGTVFRMTPTGALTTLHSFGGSDSDGQDPETGLVQAINGDLYGVTYEGGSIGLGTAFKITPAGEYTKIHNFCTENNCIDGAQPYGQMIQATNGDLYGTTYTGVNATSDGAIFQMTPAGRVVNSYPLGFVYGLFPQGGPIQGTDGNFYGTAEDGGAYNYGTVFAMTPSSGTVTALHSFDSTDGFYPTDSLVQATDGNLYGTTGAGGTSTACNAGCGTIFKITTGGTLKTIHNFDSVDGGILYGGLVQGTDGDLYGGTCFGGEYGQGTFFRVSMHLSPFVKTLPAAGNVGSKVKILGTNLEGATSVTFNGTVAVFKVVSASLITTTVPAGATTGTVQVVTPTATLLSNVPFRVP